MQIKDYHNELLQTLDFINDEDTAMETLQIVLGVITNSLDEQEARDFAAALPKELDYEKLRLDQPKVLRHKPADCVQALIDIFDWNERDAEAAMRQVVSLASQSTKGEVSKILKQLPEEWQDVFDQTPR